MYQVVAIIMMIAGFVVIFNGITIITESSIHQIYAQLLNLTGSILLLGGTILSVISCIYSEIKKKNKSEIVKDDSIKE